MNACIVMLLRVKAFSTNDVWLPGTRKDLMVTILVRSEVDVTARLVRRSRSSDGSPNRDIVVTLISYSVMMPFGTLGSRQDSAKFDSSRGSIRGIEPGAESKGANMILKFANLN